MLRIIQNQNSASAVKYYSQADYYSEGQELIGHWGGKSAERLGLNGVVGREQFQALCENRHPQTGQQLTGRTRTDRTVGYDFNFHSPKSVSLIYSLTGDERILAAFRTSVSGAMQLLERDAKTRVRKQGEMTERSTGNLAWAEFIHFTARPVKGEPDPHLHSHCFTMNCTFDPQEKIWKAVQFRDIKRDARFYEAVFHADFAQRLRGLGYEITRNAKSWEISGIDPKTIKKFSRRTALIEELARHKGILDPTEKDALGAKTRESKSQKFTTDELRELWLARLTPDEGRGIQQVAEASRRGIVAEPTISSEQALSHAIAHEFERNSVIPTRQLIETALRYGVGDVNLKEIESKIRGSNVIVRDWEGRSLATTKDVLAEERRLLAFARDGKATRAPLNSDWTIQRDWLNADQKTAVDQILNSTDRVVILKGKAGAGKTRLMQEAVQGIEASGHPVLTLAPSAEASRGVLRSEGFATADTVARFLLDTKLQQQYANQVIWIDEAGLIGTKTLANVFDIAQRLHQRVILSGDWQQHGSVERGSALRLLETDAGLKPAEVRQIQRQEHAKYRAAVSLMSAGKTLEGFNALDRLGWVQELPSGLREERVAQEYFSSLRRNEEVLVVCPTHADGERCTSAIRDLLKVKGRLGKEEHEFLKLEPKHLTEAQRADPVNYESGDILVLTQNAKGFKKGMRLTYSSELDGQLPALAGRMQVYHPAKIDLAVGDRIRMTAGGSSLDGHRFNNGNVYHVAGFTKAGQPLLNNGWTLAADWGHLDRAFVSTSHASQGRSVGRVILCQSSLSRGAASQEQFYVSTSRGKRSCLVLCDSKDSIRQQISRSEKRMTATEFVRPPVPSKRLKRLGLLQRLSRHARTLKDYLAHHFPQQRIGHAR